MSVFGIKERLLEKALALLLELSPILGDRYGL
jgi:hypothetical protein